MSTGLPSVSALKRRRSAGSRQGSSLRRPMTSFSAAATTISIPILYDAGMKPASATPLTRCGMMLDSRRQSIDHGNLVQCRIPAGLTGDKYMGVRSGKDFAIQTAGRNHEQSAVHFHTGKRRPAPAAEAFAVTSFRQVELRDIISSR